MYLWSMAKSDARSLPMAAQEDLRRRVVRAITEEGQSQLAATRLFGVSRQAITGWMRRFRRQGEAGLASGRRGRPPEPRLTAAQARQVQRWIRDRCPDQLKLPFALWTREAVRQLLVQRIGVKVSLSTVGRYLRGWGMTPQKPLRHAYERDPAAVEHWLRVEYPRLRRQARKEGATLWWEDEMGMRSDHQTGRSYSPRGRTPVLPGTGQRFGCNMISAITNRGHLCFRLFTGNLNAALFIDFLGRLRRQSGRKVFLVVDGHPAHRARQTQEWLARHRDQIRLFFLPAYSPDLNPDEMLNQDVKSNAVGRRRPHNLAEMVATVMSYVRSRQRRRDLVRRYFQEPHVAYAAT
ncbi:MAG: IS630 family transposase [Chloroflexota bacterium]